MIERADRQTTMTSRLPAILIGAILPLIVGLAVIVTLLVTAPQPGAPFKEMGPAAMAILVLPGFLLIGSLFAFPISASLVVTMTWLMRRTAVADHILAWTIAGPVFSLPASILFWQFDLSGTAPFGLLLGISLGLVGGCAAGAKRPRRR